MDISAWATFPAGSKRLSHSLHIGHRVALNDIFLSTGFFGYFTTAGGVCAVSRHQVHTRIVLRILKSPDRLTMLIRSRGENLMFIFLQHDFRRILSIPTVSTCFSVLFERMTFFTTMRLSNENYQVKPQDIVKNRKKLNNIKSF